MQMSFQDRAPLEKVKRLADGRIAAVAKFARAGTYTYSGAEVGRSDLQTVTVYRPEDEVFSQDAMASFAHQAITLGHPTDGVSPANWSKVSVGFTEGRVARDGAYVEIPLMLADAAAVQAYDSGAARELSAGYACELIWGDGIAPDGTRYQATQKLIRGNHIALVPQGRAGSECRIGDSMTQDGFISAEVASARTAHDQKFAFMGDQKPEFDESRAELLARAALNAQASKAVRSAALQSSSLYSNASARSADHSAHQSHPASAEQVRDFARSNRST